MSISLGGFQATVKGALCRVQCRVEADGFPQFLWFETDARLLPRSAAEVPNWALVAMLYPAMLSGRDLHVDANVSPRLFAAVRDDAQRLLRDYDPRTSLIRIEVAGFATDGEPSGTGVATGFSAGTDSFATIARYGVPETPPSLHLTHVFTNNVGAMGSESQSMELFKKYAARSERFASKMGWGHIRIDSNMDDFYPVSMFGDRCYQKTHTIRNAACALMFEELIKYYLYSSTFDYSKIKVCQSYDMGFIEPMLLQLLSTERTSIMSSCADLRRTDKTALVADLPEAWELLDVCVAPLAFRLASDHPNCSRCFKCTRSMVNLDILGKLDRFERVFDLSHYRANRDRIWLAVALHAMSGDANSQDVVHLARGAGMRFPRTFPLHWGIEMARGASRRMRARTKRAALSLGYRSTPAN